VPAVLDIALQGVMVTDPFGTFAATNAVLMRVLPLPAPVITFLGPPAPTTGQQVTVQGSNFLYGVQLTIAGNPVAITSLTPNQAQFLMPAGVACDAPLRLTNLGGAFAQRLINATPAITSMPYTSGPAAGGSLFILVGLNLLNTTVTFNGVPMVVTNQTATAVLGTTPPGTPGPATVLVRNANGCQTMGLFTYL
jgi:hypothetical protein